MLIIKNYHSKKEFKLTRRLLQRKRKVIDKIAKKLLRKLKAKEGKRSQKAKLAQGGLHENICLNTKEVILLYLHLVDLIPQQLDTKNL